MRRAFVVVIDAAGIGALPDAADYGDAGANTLAHLAAGCGGLRLPVLGALGLGSILPLAGVPAAPDPVCHGRLCAQGPGKDSIAGHWELMGVIAAQAPPTYPDGLPPEVLEPVMAAVGRRVICNRPYNGLAAIEDFGAEHLASGAPILYTSQDSVIQLAAHERVIAAAELARICERVRAVVAVDRVIARPFTGELGAFHRTDGRHDYALSPPARSYLNALASHGIERHAVGKAAELFPSTDFEASHPGATNRQAIESLDTLISTLQGGLVLANLIDTDQLYGHRKDLDGFHRALREIDAAAGRWLAALGRDDLLVITADHGCDPLAPHSDHTRESVPLLASFAGHGGRRHDGAPADVGASAFAWLTGACAGLPGEAFIDA
ncbi:MAG TPA: phosphopentomutase [Solirubrobacteraceae bacterium]|nr:phosphopentomutase [Solirubrobacteraceae bacterium]